MCNFIKISQNIVNQSSIAEPEHLFFILILSLITATLTLILKVRLTIHKEKNAHQILLDGYMKLLLASKSKIEKEKLNEDCFDKKQAAFLKNISEVKSQWGSLRLIINSLRKC